MLAKERGRMMSNSSRHSVSSGSPYEPRLGIARAVRLGSMVAVGGTAPFGADGQTVTPGDAPAQARRCLEIIRAALEDLGADLSHVIRTRILLTRMTDWESVGQVHGEFFWRDSPGDDGDAGDALCRSRLAH